jgi:PAS domain S-box-containing protein
MRKDALTATVLSVGLLVLGTTETAQALSRQGTAVPTEGTSTVQLPFSSSLLLSLTGTAIVLFASLGIFFTLFRQRSSARALLHERDSRLRMLSGVAQRTTNAVVITNAAGEIEWTNRAFEELTGWSLTEAAGHRPSQLVHGPGTDPDTKQFMHDAVHEGRGFTCDVLNYHRSGRPYMVSLDVQPIRREDGRLEHFISVAADVTSRYTTEQHLRETLHTAQVASQEKFSFLATMSHQLRTPLNAVLGGSSLLYRTELSPDQRRHLSLVAEGAERGLLLVDNLLTLSALEVGNRSLSYAPTDLPRLLQSLHDTCTMLPDEVTLRISVSESVPTRVSVDGPKLRQLLVNLLRHAGTSLRRGTLQLSAQPSDRGGMVTLEVLSPSEEEDPTRLIELLTPTGTDAPLRIGQDTATALGLRTSAVIARHLGGRIEADVVPGRGTFLRAMIPLPDLGARSDARQENEPRTQDLSDLSILIVDDDVVSRAVLRELLHQLANDPDEAIDGVDALNKLADTRYDILLVDIDMPRMDGLELISVLRSGRTGYSNCVAIAVTANALPEDERRFLDAGMNDYLAKPVRLNDLWEKIDRNRQRGRVGPASTTGGSPGRMESEQAAAGERPGPTAPEIPAPPESVPILDMESLSESLGLSADSGLRDIISLFLVDSRGRLETLSRQQSERDLPGMRATAHALKGASANIHAERIRSYATVIEDLTRSQQMPPEHLLDQLATELMALNSWVSDMTPAPRPPESVP